MDIQKIREDFPILSRTVYGKPLVYLDVYKRQVITKVTITTIIEETITRIVSKSRLSNRK